MNILYITFTSKRGGATTALVNIVRGMTNLGHQVFVLTNNKKGPLPEMVESAGGIVLYGPVSLTIYPQLGSLLGRVKRLFIGILGWYRSSILISKIIDKYNIQVVHSNVGPMNLALKVCQKKGIPHIWHIREYHELDLKMHFFPTQNSFFNLIHENGNYNIAITKGIFDHYKLRPQLDTVIYDGVFSEEDVEDCFIEQKEYYFLFVGRIEESKGPHNILLPFSEFLKDYPGCKLKLAGSYSEKDSYFNRMKELITEYHLVDSVEFLGHRNDIYALMRRAIAIIVPSKFEGFGFITVEAMLNNCIVIGRNTAGTKEQFDVGKKITGQEIGLRFTNDDEMLNCMFKSVREDLSQMQKIARKVAVENYSLEKGTRNIEYFYEKCINEYDYI